MSVRISPITIAGQPLPATFNQFSDNFDRGDTLWGWGNFWNLIQPQTQPTAQTYYKITSGKAEIGNNSGVSIDFEAAFITPVLPIGLFNSPTQQASAIYDSTNAAGNQLAYDGVGIYFQSIDLVGGNGGINGYILQWSTDVTNHVLLRRCDANNVVLKDPITTFVNGDKITLQGIVTSSQITLNSYLNGVLVDTTIDNSAIRSTQGMPGIGTIAHAIGKFARFDNFTCGK